MPNPDHSTSAPAVRLQLPAVRSKVAHCDVPAGRLRVPAFEIPAREVSLDAALIAELLAAARASAKRAHAPYSRFHVGAALVMADDPERRVRTGANVENASYGASVCAERTALLHAAAAGFRSLELIAVSCVAALQAPLAERSPCGVCRQVLREFTARVDARGALVCIDSGDPGVLCDVLDIERLLPWGFGLAPSTVGVSA